MKDCVYFLQALTVLQTKGMAGIRASRNREFFYYPLSAFSFSVKVKNGRYCRKMDYRSPMMLVVWVSTQTIKFIYSFGFWVMTLTYLSRNLEVFSLRVRFAYVETQ